MEDQIKCEIPTIDNCVLAIHQDMENKRETVVLGGLDSVRIYLRGNRNGGILATAKRPLGSFPADCFDPLAGQMVQLRIGLMSGIGKEKPAGFYAAQKYLEELYRSDNFAHKFLAARLWEEYQKTAAAYAKRFKSTEDKKLLDGFMDRIENLTLPFRFSIKNDIMEWQCDHPQFPMHFFDREYYEFPGGVLWAGDTETSEYGFCTVSLMPLLTYSLKQLYANKLYFQHCKLCGKLFLARTANIPTFCSEKCKREQGRRNKQKFDEQARELDYEKEHKNTYMFWLRGVDHMKKNATDPKRIAAAEQAMKDFRIEAKRRKAEVKAGKMSERDFIGWLLKQRGIIDELKQDD